MTIEIELQHQGFMIWDQKKKNISNLRMYCKEQSKQEKVPPSEPCDAAKTHPVTHEDVH